MTWPQFRRLRPETRLSRQQLAKLFGMGEAMAARHWPGGLSRAEVENLLAYYLPCGIIEGDLCATRASKTPPSGYDPRVSPTKPLRRSSMFQWNKREIGLRFDRKKARERRARQSSSLSSGAIPSKSPRSSKSTDSASRK